ncbi:MAG: hypothetical protein ABW217_13650 [Polyangiaceae bacterium]
MRPALSGRALGLCFTLGLSFTLGTLACQAQAEKVPQAEPPTAAKTAASEPAATAAAPAATAKAPAATPAAAPVAAEPVAAAPAAPAAATTGSVRPASAKTEAAPLAGKGDTKPAVPTAPAEQKAKRGAAADEEPFTAWLEGDVPLNAGQPANLRVVLQAKAPYHVNADYPHKITLDPGAGVTYPAPVAKGMQVTPAQGVLPVPVVAGPAGQATVKGKLAFSVCTEERCLIEKRELALDLDIR